MGSAGAPSLLRHDEERADVRAGRSPVTLKNPFGGDAVTVGAGGVTLMGVVNRSPESNSTDVYASSPVEAMAIARRYRASGVEVIDVGGQSTNFRNPRISAGEELDRLIPTIEALAGEGLVVSADTFRPEVASEALDAGAALVNDTSGLHDPAMIDVVSASRTPAVLMYLDGEHPLAVAAYDDSSGRAERVAGRLGARLDELAGAGVDSVIVDPGSAINYRIPDDRLARSQFEIAERLGSLAALPAPVLYAVSRWERRHWNVALAALAIAAGAAMLRIHDVEWVAEVSWLMGRLPRKPDAFGR